MRPVPTREARGQKTWTGFGAISRDRPVPPCSQAPAGTSEVGTYSRPTSPRVEIAEPGTTYVVMFFQRDLDFAARYGWPHPVVSTGGHDERRRAWLPKLSMAERAEVETLSGQADAERQGSG